MKKIKFTTVIGCLAAVTFVYFNVKHALNDYGVRDNEKLHPEVMAQAGTTSSGTTNGGTTGNGGTTNSGGTTGNGGSTTSTDNEDQDYCGATIVTRQVQSIISGGVEIPIRAVIDKRCINGNGKTCEQGHLIIDIVGGGTESGGFTTVVCPIIC